MNSCALIGDLAEFISSRSSREENFRSIVFGHSRESFGNFRAQQPGWKSAAVGKSSGKSAILQMAG